LLPVFIRPFGLRSSLFLGLTAFALGCSPGSNTDATGSSAAEGAGPVLATESGPVRGVQLDGVVSFRGIPFAASPTGGLRWKSPAPVVPWTDVRDATDFGARCAQKDLSGNMVGSEDCLFLNVWTPQDATDATGAPRPVMFFIHGGANVIGASNDDIGHGNLYDGETLARERGAVVVTANYRLGPLGFLAHPALGEGSDASSGNLAILDLLAALRWVQHNAAAVGGDPSRVMIFGESAGALNTCVLLASPLAKGLFSSALMESGECTARPRDAAEKRGAAIATSLGCTDGDVAACLRAKSPTDLFAVSTPAPNALAGWDLPYAANVDGVVLREAPLHALQDGSFNRVPVVVGSNADEMELFLTATQVLTCDDYDHFLDTTVPSIKAQVAERYPCLGYALPRWAAVAVGTDLSFTCPARRVARAAAQSVPTHRYFYKHVRTFGALSLLRAFHTAELPFVFGTFGRDGNIASLSETNLGSQIQGYWSNVASTGDPNGGSLLPWPRYDARSESVLELDDLVTTTNGIASGICDFWDSVSAH
jgi:para-nitrobenzyl esterase